MTDDQTKNYHSTNPSGEGVAPSMPEGYQSYLVPFGSCSNPDGVPIVVDPASRPRLNRKGVPVFRSAVDKARSVLLRWSQGTRTAGENGRMNITNITPDGEILTDEEFAARNVPVRPDSAPDSPGKSDLELSEKEFNRQIPDEAAAVAYMERVRWGDTPRCPRCETTEVNRVDNSNGMPFRCPDCRRYFSVKSGTVMQHSLLPIKDWLYGIRAMYKSRMGVASHEIARDLGISQKSAWHMMHRIREAMKSDDVLLAGVVEVDESYFGGKEGNKHASKKSKSGNPFDGKQAVIGLRARGGAAISFPIANADKNTLERIIAANVAPGSVIFTDGHGGYLGINELGYTHESVNHRVGEYVRGDVTTNGIESVWALVKKGYKGVYMWMSFVHLFRYLNEFTHRLNCGKVWGWGVIGNTLKRMEGKSLKWKKLTGKEE